MDVVARIFQELSWAKLALEVPFAFVLVGLQVLLNEARSEHSKTDLTLSFVVIFHMFCQASLVFEYFIANFALEL
jgi:hypothetical protein